MPVRDGLRSSSPVLLGADPSLTRLGSSSSTVNFGELGVRLLRCRRNTLVGNDEPSGFLGIVRRRGIFTCCGGISFGGCVPLYFAGGAIGCCTFSEGGGGRADLSRDCVAEVGRNRS